MDDKEKFDAKVKVSKFLSEKSVLYIRDAISKELDMPYTTLRSFLMGNRIHVLSALKVKNWLDVHHPGA